MEQGNPGRVQYGSVSSALSAANAGPSPANFPVRFPPAEDGGRGLAEVAQRDLDAALQLLADRAQYITGAAGAAIALRRAGKNDLLCRASSGSNAPQLGALLSTEVGLSGESVRTRRPLRCDDVERDARVNRDVCRELGIASVVVMPVVNDDQVLGVFELFSGKAHAFGERDLTALERLSEMVQTAIRLARAAESVAVKIPEPVADSAGSEQKAAGEALEEVTPPAVELPPAATGQTSIHSAVAAPPVQQELGTGKRLFWSAALVASTDAPAAAAEADQSHVPPVLRNLRKCEACGFPVSAGRVLCVECEEKKWRGQLKPQRTAREQAPVSSSPLRASASAGAAAAAVPAKEAVGPVPVAHLAGAKSEASLPVEPPVPMFVLSAGLEPSQSWFARNKFVIAAVVLAAIAVAAIVALR